MHGGIKSLVVLVLASGLASCSSAPVGNQRFAGLASPEILAKASLQYYWDVPLTLDKDERILHLYRLDENLYAVTDQNRLAAIDASNGMLKWIATVDDPGQPIFRPIHVDSLALSEKAPSIGEMLGANRSASITPFNAVLINSINYVAIFDRSSGRLVRKMNFNSPATSAGACDGMMYVIASSRNWATCYRLNEAVQIWTEGLDGGVAAPVRNLHNRFYVGTDQGTFYGIQNLGQSPRLLWSLKLTGPCMSAFVADRRGCFVPCMDNRLYAFDPATGTPLWDPFVCQGPLAEPCQLTEKSLFQYAQGDRFYNIDVANGRMRWTSRDGRKVLAIMNDEAYVLDAANRLQIIDEMLGKPRTVIPMTGMDVFLANTAVPAIYAATREGKIICIRTADASVLTKEQLKPAALTTKPASAPTAP